ncbi:type 1 fimbrial protein [Escherichia coli]|nr:type 1 fimbrial protein [Escherichia coli]
MAKKTVVAGAILMAIFSLGANASGQGAGVINFKGSVINAPCGIASGQDGANVEVDFAQVSKSHLENGGVEQKDFSIKLTKCDVASLQKGVVVTFSGNTVNGTTTELATSGSTGTAIVLNGYGKDITLGTATDHIKLVKGDNTLRFSSMLKQATGKAVAEGDFSAVANFNLTYE